MIETLKKQFPKGFAWKLPVGDVSLLLDALVEEPKRIRKFLELIISESNPGTATDSLAEWYQQYGLQYDGTGSVESRRGSVVSRYVGIGGQDVVYIQQQLDLAGYPQIIVTENGPPPAPNGNECGVAECGVAECWSPNAGGSDWVFYYSVFGSLATTKEFLEVQAILERVQPGHLIPNFQVFVSDNVCGPAECGVAECNG